MILAQFAIFNCVPCEVSVDMAADSASLTKSTAWLSKTLLLGVRSAFWLTALVIANKKQTTATEGSAKSSVNIV